MLQRRWRCVCGKEALVPVQALGLSMGCPVCRATATITLKNSHPVAPSPDVLKPRAENPHAEQCGRCGRKFRGEWDQNPSGDGVLCDICVRQVGQAPTANNVPTRNSETVAPLTQAESLTAADWAETYHAISPNMQLREPDENRRYYFKVACMTLAASVFAAATITYLVQFSPDSVDAYRDAQMPGLIASLIETFFSTFIIKFFSLYVVLWYFERLPNDDTLANVLAVGSVCVLLAVVGLVSVNGFLGLAGFVVYLGLMKYLYDFGWVELVAVGVASSVLQFAWSLAYLLLWNAMQ